MSNQPWYGAKLVYRHFHAATSENVKQGETWSFEERVVLIHAPNEETAMQRAEKVAKDYEYDAVEFTGFIQLFHIYGETIEAGTEVFSLIRKSQLSTDEYLDQFYDTGDECERKAD